MRDSAFDAPCGNKPASTLPPSSGGSGSRFNAINTRFTLKPISAISKRPALGHGPEGAVAANPIAQSSACRKFDPGPAAATQIMSRFGSRRLAKFTGTGLAQPQTKGGDLLTHASASNIPGTRTVPTGSTCFSGLSVIRPGILAVGAPTSLATYPCAA